MLLSWIPASKEFFPIVLSGKFQSSSIDFPHKEGTLQQKGLFATSGSTLELAFVRNSFQASLPLVVHKK